MCPFLCPFILHFTLVFSSGQIAHDSLCGNKVSVDLMKHSLLDKEFIKIEMPDVVEVKDLFIETKDTKSEEGDE